MPNYSSVSYKNSFLNQVIVRIDFLQFVPTAMTFNENVEKEILKIFPRRGKDQIIRFNSINVVFDPNNNGLPNANGEVIDGIQREYCTNDGLNKLIMQNHPSRSGSAFVLYGGTCACYASGRFSMRPSWENPWMTALWKA